VRAVLQLGRRLRAQRPKDSVSLSKLAVLATLQRLGAMPAARLAEEERLQPQSLTRIIAQMEREELVVRRRGKEDRRTLVIEITQTGRAALRRDIQQRRIWLEAAMSTQLSETEQELLRRAADLMLKVAAFQK
jgi:DNA-binding MarR family transcriptional regulator